MLYLFLFFFNFQLDIDGRASWSMRTFRHFYIIRSKRLSSRRKLVVLRCTFPIYIPKKCAIIVQKSVYIPSFYWKGKYAEEFCIPFWNLSVNRRLASHLRSTNILNLMMMNNNNEHAKRLVSLRSEISKDNEHP